MVESHVVGANDMKCPHCGKGPCVGKCKDDKKGKKGKRGKKKNKKE